MKRVPPLFSFDARTSLLVAKQGILCPSRRDYKYQWSSFSTCAGNALYMHHAREADRARAKVLADLIGQLVTRLYTPTLRLFKLHPQHER